MKHTKHFIEHMLWVFPEMLTVTTRFIGGVICLVLSPFTLLMCILIDVYLKIKGEIS